MHGWMTNRHEGCVSAMFTESDLSIPLQLRHFKGLVPRNRGCKTTSTAFRVFSVLTMRDPLDMQARPARRHIPAGRVRAKVSMFDI